MFTSHCGFFVQALLDDAQRQIGNQEKMLQRMTSSLQDKDKQLQHYLQLIQDQQVPSIEVFNTTEVPDLIHVEQFT
jgi:hypothetical protein